MKFRLSLLLNGFGTARHGSATPAHCLEAVL